MGGQRLGPNHLGFDLCKRMYTEAYILCLSANQVKIAVVLDVIGYKQDVTDLTQTL